MGKLKKSTKKNAEGFSLIELAVALAIIGILAGLSLPQFNHYRAQANDRLAESDAASSARLLAIALKN